MESHVQRRMIPIVHDRLTEAAVLALQGPRSVGKSTVLAEIAAESGVDVLNLDDAAQAAIVESSPGDFVAGPAPVCIDEYQRAPSVLQAIKAELNRQFAPGRFVLTGSTRFESLPSSTQALTGRIQFLEVLPFSQGEIADTREDFLEVALRDPDLLQRSPKLPITARDEYARRVCRGGLPIAVTLDGRARSRWFASYLAATLAGDAPDLGGLRRADDLPRLLLRLAGQTGQLLNVSNAARDVGLEARTADHYTQLLTDLFVVRKLPAWGRTLRARTGKSPKLHVIDSGLAAHMMRLSADKLARLDPASLTEFGHVLETFVVGELIKQATWHADVADIGHWRTHDGHEVDLVIETFDGSVVAFEVKAQRQTAEHDRRGLVHLRDLLGDQFRAGFVLTTGELSGRMDDRIYTCPIDRLWRAHA